MSSRLTLRLAGKRIELSSHAAVAVADHLWRGLRPGAVTAAARLSGAVAARDPASTPCVEFQEYEFDAVYDALEVVGLPKPWDESTKTA